MELKKLMMTAIAASCLPNGAAFAERTASVVRNVEYARHDDFSLKCDIYMPDASKQNGSAVLMVHGGAWMSGNKSHVTNHAWNAAEAGYVVMAINYRLAPKYRFPAQLDDCRDALRWLRGRAAEYRFREGRVVGYGYSAGAHLVCLLALTADQPELELQAVVAGGTPVDFRELPAESKVLAYWLGGSPAELSGVYESASPAAFISPDDPPMFLYHGTRDRIVPPVGSEEISDLLKEAGVEAELHWVRGKGHVGAFFDDQAARLAVRFMDKTLGDLEQTSNRDQGN